MKNMQFFSIISLTALIALSNCPMVAMEGPEFEYDRVKQGFEDATKYFKQKAQEGLDAIFNNSNAPQAEKTKPDKGFVLSGETRSGKTYFAEAISKELAKQDLNAPVVQALLTEDFNNSEVPQNIAAPIVPEKTANISQVKASFSFKKFFNETTASLKATVQAHPIITGVVVAGVIAVPLVIFGWYKWQKSKKRPVTAQHNIPQI